MFHEVPHRRFNPLIREWVLVSSQRTQRPWQGEIADPCLESSSAYDPTCYLCPGNERAGGKRNPAYTSTFVFDNDFAALQPGVSHAQTDLGGLIVARTESGICRVVCFSPRHDLTLSLMEVGEIAGVVDVWAEQYSNLGRQPEINYVQIFENRGAMMGCSNPHPHCQIWANETLPDYPAKEQLAQAEYRNQHGSCLLCDYLRLESAAGERLVCENQHFMAVVPFWAVWPFETLVVSKRHLPDFENLAAAERGALAEILKRLTTRYDNLFTTSFPYSMGFHQQPTDGAVHPEWHFHAHFFPPLLRSATIKKFMVGYELLASPQRDITAETAAERLRATSEVHWSTGSTS